MLDKSKSFTTKPLYRFISDGGVIDRQAKTIQKCNLLKMKIKVFIWLTCHNKLQSAITLRNRATHGRPTCCH